MRLVSMQLRRYIDMYRLVARNSILWVEANGSDNVQTSCYKLL
jgi:hypothetical protein